MGTTDISTDTETGRALRILIVDDDAAVRDGMARAFRRDPRGYEVETAVDGFEAGAKVSSFEPDLVFLDVVMPGMGGLEVCHRIRALTEQRDVKIVILTGYPGGGNREQSLLYDADLFLSKPQPLASLRTHVEELLKLG
ncbi:MAG: response regulator [bacterium]|nr:response regulator [bacterium]